jgi:prevent-host-death family protein
MAITTLSSREFNQELGHAKKSARKGPVFITDRGQPTHVLLSVEEYRRITGKERSVGEALSCPAAAAIEFEFEPIELDLEPADFV